MDLSDRKLKILEAIVDNYVTTGEAVSSKTLCQVLDTPLSSATIRNEMAELTELGLLEQPHTSAGRVPSHLGYRLYINTLMHRRPLTNSDQALINNALKSSLNDPEELIEGALEVLADLSKCAVAFVLPLNKSMCIKSVQIVSISKHAGILIFVTSCGNMKSKMFYSNCDLGEEVVEVSSKALNEIFENIPVEKITRQFIQSIAAKLGDMMFILSPMLVAIYEAASELHEINVMKEGQHNLLFMPEFRESKLARKAIDFLDKDDEIADLLLNTTNNTTQVLIGQESNVDELSDLSIIISKCALSHEDCGAISIIGPTRMDYGKMISSLEYLSSVIENIFKDIWGL